MKGLNMNIDPPTMFDQAVILSVSAHQGQVDKSGVPYILHPMSVASMCKTDDERVVALLHDTVEDTEITLESLLDFFPPYIVDAVEAITHQKGEPYAEYLERVVQNEIAAPVKVQDVKHNMGRMEFLTDVETKEKLTEKYKYALEFLKGFMNNAGVAQR